MPLVETSGAGVVRTLTLNRPEQRNAVSSAMLVELVRAPVDLTVDPECRAVVLRGEGKDFCSGADMKELAEARADETRIPSGMSLEEALRTISTHPVPVIAQVQGAALGAGCQVVVACDLAVAAEDARFAIPSARLGILLNYESVERLVLAVGPKRAGELLYTGRVISGEEAMAWGLVNDAVEPEALAARTARMASFGSAGDKMVIPGIERSNAMSSMA